MITFSTDGEVEFAVQVYFEYGSTEEDPVFELSEERLDLYVGESAKLTITSEPEDVLFDAEWQSSNKKVATVDQNGQVVAKDA